MRKVYKKLPKELRTVTPLSKTVAIAVFITLPFVGFVYGRNYQSYIDNLVRQVESQEVYNSAQMTPPPSMQMCTMDAKLCPDGSYVGRTSPTCEFAPCPGE